MINQTWDLFIPPSVFVFYAARQLQQDWLRVILQHNSNLEQMRQQLATKGQVIPFLFVYCKVMEKAFFHYNRPMKLLPPILICLPGFGGYMLSDY